MRPTTDIAKPTLELAELFLYWCIEAGAGRHAHAAESRDEFALCWLGSARRSRRLRRERRGRPPRGGWGGIWGRRARRGGGRPGGGGAETPQETPLAEPAPCRAPAPRVVCPLPLAE